MKTIAKSTNTKFRFHYPRIEFIFLGIAYTCEIYVIKFSVNLQCTAGTVCKKTCAGEALDCYILDDNGFIILSEDASQTGLFFGQVDGTIMDSLVQDRIYKKVTVHDRQGRCPDSRNPFSGDGCKLAVSCVMLPKLVPVAKNKHAILVFVQLNILSQKSPLHDSE